MESRYSTINTTTLLLRPFFCPEKIERPVISLFHNLDKSTTLLTTTFSWPDSVDSHTLFHCTSSLENVFSRSPIGVVSFFFQRVRYYSIAVPSSPPSSFSLSASSSTSITVSWRLPPLDSRNGIITGFKVFYKKKDSAGSATMVAINSGTTLTKAITGLDKYTEYEFQLLAFTSVGDGPNSIIKVEKTIEDGKKC